MPYSNKQRKFPGFAVKEAGHPKIRVSIPKISKELRCKHSISRRRVSSYTAGSILPSPCGRVFVSAFIPLGDGYQIICHSAREGEALPARVEGQPSLRGAGNPIEDSCFERQLPVIFKLQISGTCLRKAPRMGLCNLFSSPHRKSWQAPVTVEKSVCG